ncbi:A/G-specific adenine glycosylase [Thiorhodovibrio winogradskyi]|uniref:Adenine DNA glycosylase n=1 Tax=Thiorhodovibrio winogradskyi TaxID=77007 RepID=A0ABZ0S398_9GAMM|nr:A/G-specific adenine glycosylase [Thiorhodovibrio winogradskyi]
MNQAWLPDAFADCVLQWFACHGRKDLPWQLAPTPYRVWVSEIMLQQTQVAVVIPYFERFIGCFPNLGALATATEDEVLQHWSGLGYYARARNLHRSARIVLEQHGGELPEQLEWLIALPGIGRSTAGAILSLAYGQAHAILDGNVKRVLARCFAVAGWPGESRIQKHLWALADELLSAAARAGLQELHLKHPNWPGTYNQAMMDLGATVCTRAAPDCNHCPLSRHCLALMTNSIHQYPQPKPKRPLPRRATRWLLVQDPDGRILLEQRPPSGLWGGLWTFPEVSLQESSAHWCELHLYQTAPRVEKLPDRQHSFSHFHLDIYPERLLLKSAISQLRDSDRHLWVALKRASTMAVPAPVKAILLELLAMAKASKNQLLDCCSHRPA